MATQPTNIEKANRRDRDPNQQLSPYIGGDETAGEMIDDSGEAATPGNRSTHPSDKLETANRMPKETLREDGISEDESEFVPVLPPPSR